MRRTALNLLAVGVAALAWRFYFVGPPPMDAATILRGWEAAAVGSSPYAADFGVNYPPAVQWIGGILVAVLGSSGALFAYRLFCALGCILGLVGIARLAALPEWLVVAVGSASCVPMIEGLSIGNPGPAVAGLGVWALAARGSHGLGLSLALKPLLVPAWIARWFTDRAQAELAAVVAFAATVPAIGLLGEWLHRVRDWEPLWNAATGRAPIFPSIPTTTRMVIAGVACGLAGRRWAVARRPEVLCLASFAALPVLWDHSQVLLVPALVSGAAWLVRQSRLRHLAWPLAAALALAITSPAVAGWTKQANNQCSGKTALDCVPCGTGVVCRDETPGSSGTNRVIKIASDYTVTLISIPSINGFGKGSVSGIGCNSDGSRMYVATSAAQKWYADSPFSSWNSISQAETVAGHMPRGGTQANKQYGISFQAGWNPQRVYATYFDTTSGSNGGSQFNLTADKCSISASGGSDSVFTSGCWRTATVFDVMVTCLPSWFTESHLVSFSDAYAPLSYSLSAKLGGSSKTDQALHCSSDGATSITGIRAPGRTLVIRRGSVSRSDEVAANLVGTYSGTGFEGTTGRYLMTTTGVLWKDQDAAAPLDMAGTTYDLTLDASDVVAVLATAPDGTKPMVVTGACDVFTFVGCTDADGDGYGNPGAAGCTNGSATDCNDASASIYPGATEIPNDGIDQDCDGVDPVLNTRSKAPPYGSPLSSGP